MDFAATVPYNLSYTLPGMDVFQHGGDCFLDATLSLDDDRLI